jgi:hypothetical protein
MLKAKFSLTLDELKPFIAKANEGSSEWYHFITSPVTYNDKQTNVVGDEQPIMFLIGEVANGGFDSLLDVTRL